MTDFHNANEVYNQAGIQHNHGPAFNGPTYNGPVHITNTISKQERVIEFDSATNAFKHDNEILRFLSFPEMFERRVSIEKAHPDTCKWVLDLDVFKAWNDQQCGLLWIKGKPGAGKSTLMSFLYSSFTARRRTQQLHEVYLDFFFSARGSELQRTAEGMLRSLLNQIFSQVPAVRPSIRQAFRDKASAFGSIDTNWSWSKSELEELFSNAVSEAAKDMQVNIFVDALDEAGETFARKIAAYFHQLNDRSLYSDESRCRICISCRHYPIVAAVQGTEICVEEHNHADISRFINDRLKFDGLISHGQIDDCFMTELKQMLIQSSAGVFQWVYLMVQLIQDYILEGEAPAVISSRLKNLPKELNSLYEYILYTIIKPEYRSQSFLLFQWVCLAVWPLSVTEMRYALAATEITVTGFHQTRCHEIETFIDNDQRMEFRIRALSGGLIEVVDEMISNTKIVQVIHQSVTEYILMYGLQVMSTMNMQLAASINSDSYASPQTNPEVLSKCHKTLYQSCYQYLVTEKPSENEYEVISASYQHLKNWSSRIAKATSALSSLYPFIAYANNFLFYHAGKSVDWLDGEIIEHTNRLNQLIIQWGRVDRFLKDSGQRDGSPVTTLLHEVCAAQWLPAARYLVKDRTLLFNIDDVGNTPLHVAACHGNLDLAVVLIQAGANLQLANDNGRTPLMLAATCRDPSMVKLLLRSEANQSELATNINRAFISAVCAENPYIAQLLLDAGANVDAQNAENMSALEIAAFQGSPTMVELLLKAGANFDRLHGRYGSALQAATYLTKYFDENLGIAMFDIETVLMLMKAGANINAHWTRIDTPLCAAVFEQRNDAARLLLYLGADPSIPCFNTLSPLQYAILYRSNELVHELLSFGASTGYQDLYGRTALHHAACADNFEAVRMLLSAKANPLVLDHFGRTFVDVIMSNTEHFQPLFGQELNDDSDLSDMYSFKLVTTPEEVRVEWLERSIADIAVQILETNDCCILPGLQEIGDCLLLLQDTDGATFAFHQADATKPRNFRLSRICSNCKIEQSSIHRYMCKTCPQRSFCPDCFDNPNRRLCANHDIFQRTFNWEQPDQFSERDSPRHVTSKLRRWLQGFVKSYGPCSFKFNALRVFMDPDTKSSIPVRSNNSTTSKVSPQPKRVKGRVPPVKVPVAQLPFRSRLPVRVKPDRRELRYGSL